MMKHKGNNTHTKSSEIVKIFCTVHTGADLLTPTNIYIKSVLPLMHEEKVKAFAHITGGGLIENIPRVLPDDMEVRLDAKSWIIPPVFGWIADAVSAGHHSVAIGGHCLGRNSTTWADIQKHSIKGCSHSFKITCHKSAVSLFQSGE